MKNDILLPISKVLKKGSEICLNKNMSESRSVFYFNIGLSHLPLKTAALMSVSSSCLPPPGRECPALVSSPEADHSRVHCLHGRVCVAAAEALLAAAGLGFLVVVVVLLQPKAQSYWVGEV